MAIKFLDSTGLTYFINKIVYGITSPKFSTGSTYAVGNFVIYTGKLYRCTTAVTVAGAWSASHWTATTVSAELATTNSNLMVNGTPFIWDIQQGKAGYNTDPARGADTFHPFQACFDLGTGTSFDVSKYQDYKNFSLDNFAVTGNSSVSESWVDYCTVSNLEGVAFSHSPSGGLTQNYNADTGVLIAYVYTSEYGHTATKAVHVYLIR